MGARFQGYLGMSRYPSASSIVDFYYHDKRLAVEINDPVHSQGEAVERDQAAKS